MKSLYLSLMIAIIAIIAFGCGSDSTPGSSVTDQITLIDDKGFDKASKEYSAMLEANPSDAAAICGLGTIDEAQLQLWSAMNRYATALEIDENFAPAWAGMSRIYSLFDDPDLAADRAAKYLEKSDGDYRAAVMLAQAMLDRGTGPQMRTEMNKWPDIPAPLSGLLEARSFAVDGDFDQARNIYNRTLETPLDSVLFWELAADCMEEMGQIDSAIVLSRKTLTAAGNTRLSFNRHVLRALKHGYFYEARRTTAPIDSAGETRLWRAALDLEYALARRDRTAVIAQANRGLDISPDAVDAQYNFMRAHAKVLFVSQIDQERSMANGMVERQNWPEEIINYMAYKTVIVLFRIIPERETIFDVSRVRGMLSNRREIKVRSTFIKREVGLDQEFAEETEQLIKYHTTQPDWLSDVAEMISTAGGRDFKRAESLYTTSLNLDPSYAPAFIRMVNLMRSRKQYKRALEAFDKYPQFKTFPTETALLYPTVLVENDRYTDARDAFIEAYRPISGEVKSFDDFNQLLYHQQQNDAVVELVKLLQTEQPENPDALTSASLWFSKLGRADEALTLANQALGIESDFMDARGAKARALYLSGSVDQAFDLFEETAGHNRDNLTNNLFFSISLSDEKIRPSEAQNLARKTMYTSMDGFEPWMALCYAYLQGGRSDLCLGDAKRSLSAYADKGEPYFYLGLAQKDRGVADYKKNLQKAIDLGMDEENMKIARKALK
ncbi:MAG TPA: hypothetical protein PLF13_11630 [candidate division Zixibacteria bacterium]|nr:hypothetical protein [candidate division Zixibacteria bacterium]